jgi:hypothetical protein
MFPILVVLMGLSMQEALNFYAKEVALGASQAGVDAVRYAHLGPNDESQAEAVAFAAARDYVAKHGGNLLNSPGMVTPVMFATAPANSPGPGAGMADPQIKVEIKGKPISLVSVLAIPVDQHSQAAAETFTYGTGN